jgi:hypothetical protein
VFERLNDLFIRCDVPDCIRSDNGPEFTTRRVEDCRESVEVKTLFNESGSPSLPKAADLNFISEPMTRLAQPYEHSWK